MASEHAHACSRALSPALPCSHAQTRTLLTLHLPVSVFSHAAAAGPCIYLSLPCDCLPARLPLCTSGFDMEIWPEEPGKPLMRDRESGEKIKEHKRKRGAEEEEKVLLIAAT